MNYNLTSKQRDLLKDIVEEVRAGNLEDEFYVAWLMGGSEAVLANYKAQN